MASAVDKPATYPAPEAHEHFVTIPTRVWKIGFVAGTLVWILSAVITIVTKDDILVPTVIILGSFLVPGTLSAFALSRKREGYLTTEEVVLGFFMAGTLAVVATAVLETYLLPEAKGTFIGVAIIEELGKLMVLILVAHRVHHREPRDGMVLGVIVGAGFASFESAGYALKAMLDNLDARPIENILESEAFRAVLSPFGHITWTALLGGALFASAHHGARFHVTRRLVLTALGVMTLHALWDQSYGWAVMLTRGVLDQGWALLWPNAQHWQGVPPSEALTYFNIFYTGLLCIWGLIGTVWIIHTWRMYGRRDTAEVAPEQATRAAG
jgi:protease PrsW